MNRGRRRRIRRIRRTKGIKLEVEEREAEGWTGIGVTGEGEVNWEEGGGEWGNGRLKQSVGNGCHLLCIGFPLRNWTEALRKTIRRLKDGRKWMTRTPTHIHTVLLRSRQTGRNSSIGSRLSLNHPFVTSTAVDWFKCSPSDAEGTGPSLRPWCRQCRLHSDLKQAAYFKSNCAAPSIR